MMKPPLILCVCLALVPLILGQTTTESPDARPFAFIGSRYMSPGVDYELNIHILRQVPTDVNVTFEVTEIGVDISETIITRSYTIPAYNSSSKTIVLRPRSVPQSTDLGGYTLNISCDRVTCSDVINLNVNRYNGQSPEIFVQTDKAIYKAGDAVKFRAIVIQPDLTPFNGLASIKIKDPRDNIVRRWSNRTLQKGVFGSSLQLSEDPILGEWTIAIDSFDQLKTVQKTQSFIVTEYVLPKFYVDVDVPSYHVLPEGEVLAKINAKYTHGGGVNGTATITIKPYISYCVDPSEYQRIYCNTKQKMITQQSDDGKIELELSKSQLFSLLPTQLCHEVCEESDLAFKSFEITVKYTEAFTDISMWKTNIFYVGPTPVKVRFATSSPHSYQVGIPYRGFASLERYDGSPLTDSDLVDSSGRRRRLSVAYVTCNMDCEYYDNLCREHPARQFDISEDGHVPFEVTFEAVHERITIKLEFIDKYGNKVTDQKDVAPFCRGTSEALGLNVNVSTDGLQEGRNLDFHVVSTTTVNTVYYTVVANNKLIHSGQTSFPGGARYGRFSLSLTSDLYKKMVPSAKVMAWAVTSGGSFIADTMQFKVEMKLDNEVTVQFDQAESSPGQRVTLSVKAAADSLVGILGVDKSVKLLGTWNDITRDEVLHTMAGRSTRSYLDSWSLMGLSIESLLYDTGLFVSTSADQCDFYDKECDSWTYVLQAATSAREDENVGVGRPSPGLRTLFPETWIWMEEETGPSGQLTYTATLPDTITTWEASSWAINTRDGLGVAAKPASVRSVKSFFVTLNLPYSVVRGEEFLLKVNVFNYMPNEEQISVTLVQSSDYTSLVNGAQSSQDVQRSVRIPSGQSRFVSYLILPRILGQIDIVVRAQSSQARDAVVRKLLVKPEGTEESVVQTRYISLSSSNPSYTTTFNIDMPSNVVEGSQRVKLSVSGSVMSPLNENIGSISKKPYGCGEQNMVNFVPNIKILQYQKDSGLRNLALEKKAREYVILGYQREMNYHRTDGSFSAFGDSDRYGSTWLTAYVIKSFAQASKFIDIVDEDTMYKSVEYLLYGITPPGKFDEDVSYGNPFLKGGSGSGIPMTAYVIIALTTQKNDMPMPGIQYRVEETVVVSLNYLKREFSRLTDPYTVAIVTYALAMNNRTSQVNAIARLDQLATNEDGEMHWGTVEATGYAMLAKLTANPSNPQVVLPSLRWLVKKFGKNGGFSSTQDTVIALAALSKFASLTSVGGNLDLTIRAVANNRDTHTFDRITRNNMEVYQVYRYSNAPRQITVTASSSGSALIQVEADYNILDPENTDDLNIIVDTEVDTIGKVFVRTCVRWNQISDSGMAIVEINPLSGYEIITDRLLEEYKDQGLKRIETKGNKLITYWEEITRVGQCFNVTQFKIAEVRNRKPGEISAYSYYSVSAKAKKILYQPSLDLVNPCDLCSDCCSRTDSSANNNNNNTVNNNINSNNNNNNQVSIRNVARNKLTRQSSTYNGDGVPSGPEKAVDGCARTNYPSECCMHTGIIYGNASWWNVDLGQVYFVSNVTYYRRSDCCEQRNRDLIVAVSNSTAQENTPVDMNTLDICGETQGIAPVKNAVVCNKYGQYVYVMHRAVQVPLSLCEVEVYARV